MKRGEEEIVEEEEEEGSSDGIIHLLTPWRDLTFFFPLSVSPQTPQPQTLFLRQVLSRPGKAQGFPLFLLGAYGSVLRAAERAEALPTKPKTEGHDSKDSSGREERSERRERVCACVVGG